MEIEANGHPLRKQGITPDGATPIQRPGLVVLWTIRCSGLTAFGRLWCPLAAHNHGAELSPSGQPRPNNAIASYSERLFNWSAPQARLVSW